MSGIIKIFEEKQVLTHWDADAEKWWFSIADICEVLTDSPDGRKYWSVLKTRLRKEGSELATNCSQPPETHFFTFVFKNRDRLSARRSFGSLRKPRFLLGTRASCPHFSRRCGRAARVPRGFRRLPIDSGGEGGIRTHGKVTPTHAFQACSFNHSDTSPEA